MYFNTCKHTGFSLGNKLPPAVLEKAKNRRHSYLALSGGGGALRCMLYIYIINILLYVYILNAYIYIIHYKKQKIKIISYRYCSCVYLKNPAS